MFRNILTRLFPDNADADALSSHDAEVAIAALLVRLARADDCYGQAEKVRIDQILMRRRGLAPPEAAERRRAAEMIEAEAPDTVRFTRTIKERIDIADRQDVLLAMWDVALADGATSPDEESLVRLAASLLGINDRDSGLARQRVIEARGHAEQGLPDAT